MVILWLILDIRNPLKANNRGPHNKKDLLE
jgi:hypothetical protein